MHVIRYFEEDTIVHVDCRVDPLSDIDVITTELVLADIQTLENRIARLDKQAKGDRKLQPLLDIAKKMIDHLNTGAPATLYSESGSDAYMELTRETKLISAKPVIYAANVDEAGLAEDN